MTYKAKKTMKLMLAYEKASRAYMLDCNTRLNIPKSDAKRKRLCRKSANAFRNIMNWFNKMK